MSNIAGLGRGRYLLLSPALVAFGTREHKHYVGNTRLEVSVSPDSSSIINSHCRRGEEEEEALSQS